MTLLSDKQAAEIERQRRDGVSAAPIVLGWVDRLLADRKERVKQLQHLQRRLRQAFVYFDRLITNGGEQKPVYQAPATGKRESRAPVVCPICTKPYLRARGVSPSAIEYEHEGGRRCQAG